MFAVPLGLFGVAVMLFITGTALSVISLLGILILGGNVVNNAIVLIDFVNGARRAGTELIEACIESVFVRFRPIIMSTVTTIVGLIPLALGIGEGAELQAPLAIAMIGGLSSGTVLTLCVIPAIYILVTRFLDGLFQESYLEGGTES
jgi:HAE1 family hydrophobic/amphiphilic exporter-1